MILKEADDKRPQIEALENLLVRPDVSADVKKKIEQQIRNIRAGAKGESEAAYEIGFHFAASRNIAVIHDLRLECNGQVAQIDHLLINRLLDVWVCESKHFAEGVGINEHGEFTAFYGGRGYGIPSPLEQNKKHIQVLAEIFRSGMICRPTRLGFAIPPTFHSMVLVSKNARISRPRAKIAGLENLVKTDQFEARLDRMRDQGSAWELAKVIASDTLEALARSLIALHRPITFNWPARFGLPEVPPAAVVAPGARSVKARMPERAEATPAPAPSEPEPITASDAEGAGDRLGPMVPCASCATDVPPNIAWFCRINKKRFGGAVYCRECQKGVPGPAAASSASAASGSADRAPAKEPGIDPHPSIAAAMDSVPAQAPPPAAVDTAAPAEGASKAKYACAACAAAVEQKVARFCWFNKARFGGKVFCRECQAGVQEPA